MSVKSILILVDNMIDLRFSHDVLLLFIKNQIFHFGPLVFLQRWCPTSDSSLDSVRSLAALPGSGPQALPQCPYPLRGKTVDVALIGLAPFIVYGEGGEVQCLR